MNATPRTNTVHEQINASGDCHDADIVYAMNFARTLERELATTLAEVAKERERGLRNLELANALAEEAKAFQAEVAREKTRADKWQQWLENTRQGGQTLASERDELKASLTLAQERVRVLREACHDIHDTAHCISKAGPLIVKNLDQAWGKFDLIACKAVEALSKTHERSELKLSATAPAQPDETK